MSSRSGTRILTATNVLAILEFIKAAEEYNTLAAAKGWKVFEFDTWGE